jgi:hypothetical protein
MLNDTLVFDSDEEYMWMGTETSPKEIVAVPIDRAGIGEAVRGIGVLRLTGPRVRPSAGPLLATAN